MHGPFKSRWLSLLTPFCKIKEVKMYENSSIHFLNITCITWKVVHQIYSTLTLLSTLPPPLQQKTFSYTSEEKLK
jgi:hypothetical protein